jgi:pimeloyl-ACP methyl ester carboxylesterase
LKRVRVGGRWLRLRERGPETGAPVLIVPGLGLSSRAYRSTLEGLAGAGARVLVPDVPGYAGLRGGSGWTPESMAGLFEALADEVAPGGATWIGHSLGWQTAARVAARRPELVTRLVVAAPTLPGPRRRQLGRFAAAAWRESWRVRLLVARDYLRTSPHSCIGTWYRFAADDVRTLLPRVRCPVRIVIGSRDPMLTAAERASLLAHFADAGLRIVPGGTHGVPFGLPARFVEAVADFAAG